MDVTMNDQPPTALNLSKKAFCKKDKDFRQIARAVVRNVSFKLDNQHDGNAEEQTGLKNSFSKCLVKESLPKLGCKLIANEIQTTAPDATLTIAKFLKKVKEDKNVRLSGRTYRVIKPRMQLYNPKSNEPRSEQNQGEHFESVSAVSTRSQLTPLQQELLGKVSTEGLQLTDQHLLNYISNQKSYSRRYKQILNLASKLDVPGEEARLARIRKSLETVVELNAHAEKGLDASRNALKSVSSHSPKLVSIIKNCKLINAVPKSLVRSKPEEVLDESPKAEMSTAVVSESVQIPEDQENSDTTDIESASDYEADVNIYE